MSAARPNAAVFKAKQGWSIVFTMPGLEGVGLEGHACQLLGCYQCVPLQVSWGHLGLGKPYRELELRTTRPTGRPVKVDIFYVTWIADIQFN